MTHTADTIKNLLATSNVAVEKGILVIYARQTSDEQATATTRNVNGRGFSAFDAEILSSFASQIEKKVSQGKKLGECLSPKQMELARKKMARYARQLAEVANNKAQEVKPSELVAVAPVVASVPPVVVSEPGEKASFTYWLRCRGEGWQQLTYAQALKWYDNMVKLAKFYRLKVTFQPFDAVTESRFWMNHAGDLLQLVKDGESIDPADWMPDASDAMIAHAKTMAPVVGEEPEDIRAEREDAMRGEDDKYSTIKASIKAWASK